MIRCSSCANAICDPYYLFTDNRYFHLDCLRCSVCNAILNNDRSMFLKRGMILCKADYLRASSGSCSGCGQMIPANCYALKIPCTNTVAGTGSSWLHYHPACLHCSHCRQPMAPGDRYVLRQDNRGVVCLNAECTAANPVHQNGATISNVTATTGGRKRGRQSNSVKAKAEKLNQF